MLLKPSQLQLLAKEDPGRASEYDLRRALMYHSLQRTDLAGETLEKVDVSTVADPKLLKAAYLVFIEYKMPEAARRCLGGAKIAGGDSVKSIDIY